MRRLLHRCAQRLSIIAALALMFAQVGATAHGYAHHGAAPASTAGHSSATLHNPCSDCLAYAPLLAAAGTPTALPLVGRQPPGTSHRPVSNPLVDATTTLAFRSRAPPSAS